MKTIGLLGGMSWESTQTYYRLINEGVKSRLGGLHSAKLVLYSVDFAEIEAAGIEVITPDNTQRDEIHRVIYEELCRGEIKTASREAYLRIVTSLSEQGAQAVILGCTEIGLLIRQADTAVPLYDTTAIHAAQAVSQALSEH